MKIINVPVEMIAWFTDAGDVRPFRFRIKDEQRANIVFKIDRIVTKSEEKFAGNRMMVFRCQSLVAGQEKIYELKYEISTCKWVLWKI
ncbi:hypothetical protein [Candidatus Formimonas warabiya]|uniref:Uncharacterized protein n=1 Tax=Formimonas warabiya TaxID=1761012 RepID=A0A3G1KQJ7_FORW1|nr:hypothetical protein [Candidatus Formimonas warabiya]ATW24734.1 hypothetical protein DCMF_08055 [Candidatus Formimonas warabiya]